MRWTFKKLKSVENKIYHYLIHVFVVYVCNFETWAQSHNQGFTFSVSH